MVASCCALNCTVNAKKRGISFFGFPSNMELRQKWIDAIRRKDFNPNKFTKICEKHFEEDCFQPKRWTQYKKLKENSIPTIFNFPEGFDYIKKMGKPRTKDRSEEKKVEKGKRGRKPGPKNLKNLGAQTSDEEVILTEKVAGNDSGNLQLATIEHINCPNCVTKTAKIGRAQSLLKAKTKKIKTLEQKCVRQERKLNNYKLLIQHLHRKNLIDTEISELLKDYIPEGGEIVLKINVPNNTSLQIKEQMTPN